MVSRGLWDLRMGGEASGETFFIRPLLRYMNKRGGGTDTTYDSVNSGAMKLKSRPQGLSGPVPQGHNFIVIKQ